jgi:hypothetical protein
MAFSIEITRPDDLLRLRIEGRNLRVDRRDDAGPALVVDDLAPPAHLLIHFPPQAIAETAFYEAEILEKPDVPPPPLGPPTQPPQTIDSIPPNGSVPARIAQASRLAFTVPSGTRIPLTIAGLLDWSTLEPSLHGIAAIGPTPTPAEIAAAPPITRPAETHTALELPYRLVVSPSAAVRWAHRQAPFTARGRTELWHTRLVRPGDEGPAELTPAEPASLRAIWSDDFNTPNGLNPDEDDPQLGRAAMTPNDRHQIVVKTSAFRGYESEVTIQLGGPLGLGTTAAPSSAAIAGPLVGFSPIIGAGIDFTYWVPYVPQPFYADQVMLSSLGGWLRSRGAWTLARKARPRFRAVEALEIRDVATRLLRSERTGVRADDDLVGPAADLVRAITPIGIDLLRPPPGDEPYLNLSEWVHVAAQGRDHYVKIVYEGELLPFRNRAALVKVTERKFKTQGSLVVAHLFQRNFIVVREPVKTFADDDRGMPFKRVEITTLVTPTIASPDPQPFGSQSFWVEVMTSTTTRVRLPFLAIGTDVAGRAHDLSIPMLFLSQAAQGTVREQVIANYNDSSTIKAVADRSASVPGHAIQFAAIGTGASPENARLATRSMTFALHNGRPRLLKAEVSVPQVQELLGKNAPTTIRLYPGYIDGGLDAGAGVFAEVVRDTPAPGDPFAAVTPTTLGVDFSADQAGGFATPNMGVSTLSQRRGPLAGKVADAVADTFDPKSFFPKGLALLFGTFDLFDLLLGGGLGEGAPQLRTTSADIPGGKLLTATLDWTPKVNTLDLGVAAFEPAGATKLVVVGKIERRVLFDAPTAPADVTSTFTGTLNDFTVTILRLVSVKFVLFKIHATSGAKPDVTVRLDPDSPLVFKGDLAFVEELRNAIPPDLFGDGPSLDLTPTGIRAGFSFTLPPVSVGVFALRDVSLGAGLTVPFLDGRPSLDFNVSERAHPFLLSVSFFGGGGFFHLQLDTAGLKLVEAAFEFGATASIDLGVASGGVHIMAGIYFKLERKEPGTDLAPTLTGYLRMGGHLSVLGLIKISLEFVLSFTYDGGRDKAYGRATLTVQVEIVFFSTSVEITVEKAFGGSSGDPTFKQLVPTADIWAEYAEAFA